MSKNWMNTEINKNFGKVKDIDSNKLNQLKTKEVFGIQYIDSDKIIKNKLNFYPIDDIDELAEDIKENGLAHNIVVRPLPNDSYEIISGERRFTALTKLRNEGMEEYKTIPCKIIKADDIQAMIMLIQANSQSREITENIKIKQVALLNKLYAEKKASKKMLTKEIQEQIANDLNISFSQVRKYEAITKASDSIQEGFANHSLTFSEATSLSRLSKPGQEVAMEIIEHNEKIDVENLKKEIQTIEKEHKKGNLNTDELHKNFEEVKDKYLTSNASMETSGLVKKQIAQVNKKLENINDKINDLNVIDDDLMEKLTLLEKNISNIKAAVDLLKR